MTADIRQLAKASCGFAIRMHLSKTTVSPAIRPTAAKRCVLSPQPQKASTTQSTAVAGDAVNRELARLGVTADRLTPDERIQIISSLEAGGIFLLKGASRMWPMRFIAHRPASTATYLKSKKTKPDSFPANKQKMSALRSFFAATQKEEPVMLIPVTAADVPDFLIACTYEHVFGSRARTALSAHGLGSEAAQFFLCRKGRELAAALCFADGVLTISSDERADPAPIAELAQRLQVHEIDTNWTQCQALQALLGGQTDSSYYMVYRGAPQQLTARISFPATTRGIRCIAAQPRILSYPSRL